VGVVELWRLIVAGRGVGRASKVIAGIDERLGDLNRELASHDELIAERERLRAARATLLGESPTGQISQDDVAAFLVEHPGSRAGEIARALGVSAGRVSAHLYRAKTTRFVSRSDGWYLRDRPTRGSR
jgi:DNA-directed RNA polymerase specialized sigma24 family protein